jgi:hypothetical protein
VSSAFLLSFFTHTSRQTRFLDFKNHLHTHIQEKDLRAQTHSIQNNNGEYSLSRRAEKEEENGGTIGDG